MKLRREMCSLQLVLREGPQTRLVSALIVLDVAVGCKDTFISTSVNAMAKIHYIIKADTAKHQRMKLLKVFYQEGTSLATLQPAS